MPDGRKTAGAAIKNKVTGMSDCTEIMKMEINIEEDANAENRQGICRLSVGS